MSGFSEQAVAKRLSELNNTLPSIQTLSLWLLHHKKHSGKIVEIWSKELRKERRPPKILNLFYLANDVIQNSRKKWPPYQEQFAGVLIKAFEHAAKYGDEKTLQSIKRILAVWRDRNVYSASIMENLTYAVTSNLTSKQLQIFEDLARTPPREDSNAPSSSGNSPTLSPIVKAPKLDSPKPKMAKAAVPANAKEESVVEEDEVTPASILSSHKKEEKAAPAAAPSTEELIVALKQLEEPASADAQIRERIAAFPEAVANPVFLKEISNKEQADRLYKAVNDAQPIVSTYCSRLADEMAHRKHTQEMLGSYLEAQKSKAEKTLDLLNQFREKRDKLAQEMREVYKHYDSLPDLEKTNSELLAPLPSARDLFN